MRVSSMTDIILMKLYRVKQIEDNEGQTLVSEGIEANYQDMINYSVFCLIKLNYLVLKLIQQEWLVAKYAKKERLVGTAVSIKVTPVTSHLDVLVIRIKAPLNQPKVGV